MSTVKSARRWFLWHKWTSLICTLFLLLLCITGLPLIFYHEIDHWLEGETQLPPLTIETPRPNLDSLHHKANMLYPDKAVRYIFWDEEESPNQVFFDVAPAMAAPPDSSTYVAMDARTGELIDYSDPREGLMYFILQLHTDMFAGPIGKLFLGLMGILFIIAIVSGVMLYGPIMKKFDFGMIRSDKSRRLKWLDMHNMLGIITLAWTLVVGATGVINTLHDVILVMWQQGQLAEMVEPYKNTAPIEGAFSSLDKAIDLSESSAPEMDVSLIAFPGTIFTSNHHYAVFMKGNTPVTSRLLKPALIDAETGELTDIRAMPWYVNTLFLSQPLHFGDYGGTPLKIIWVLFDIATIIILISGLYLWFSRMKAANSQSIRLKEKELEVESLAENTL